WRRGGGSRACARSDRPPRAGGSAGGSVSVAAPPAAGLLATATSVFLTTIGVRRNVEPGGRTVFVEDGLPPGGMGAGHSQNDRVSRLPRKRGDNHEAMDPHGRALSERGSNGGRVLGHSGGEFSADTAPVRRRPRP